MITFHFSDLLVPVFCLAIHVALRSHFRRQNLPLPPGPPRWPLIGSTLSFPMKYSGRAFAELGKQLDSKIIYHEVFGRKMVILNDLQMSKDLLEKRSQKYSSRPQLTVLRDIMNIDFLFAVMPYGEKWRHHRKLFQQYFSPHEMQLPQEIELDFVRKFLLPMLYQDPVNFRDAITGCLGGISTAMTYGVPVRRNHDPLVKLVDEAFAHLARVALPGEFFVEIIPWLRYVPQWVPGTGWKAKIREWTAIARRALEEPFQATQNALASGTASKSFVSTYLEQMDNAEEVQQIKEAATMVYGAAAETTSSALLAFIFAMLRYPDVQRKAQKELDSVVGNRLPEFSDKDSLPYFTAVLKEVLRWNPVAPIGIPHLTHEDDIYHGYYIPAESTVISNIFAILHDEEVYENPDAFNPERFIQNGKVVVPGPDPDVVTFGFGRRVCPGAHIALSTLYIVATSILCLFDISYETDENGKPIEPTVLPHDLYFTPTSVVSGPLPFGCKITPRAGKNVENMLKEYIDIKVIE